MAEQVIGVLSTLIGIPSGVTRAKCEEDVSLSIIEKPLNSLGHALSRIALQLIFI
jgi:hypothetical protein